MVQTNKIIAVVGAVVIGLVFIALVLQVPAQAAVGEPLLVHQNTLTESFMSSSDTPAQGNTTVATLSCREGVTGREPYFSEGIDIQSLGGGIYLDFQAHAPAPQPGAMEFIQVLRIHQDKDSNGNYLPSYVITPALSDAIDGVGPIIASSPGSLWLVGNEPDRGPDVPGGPAQDDTFPEVYARVYHDVYQFIKLRDPTAQVAVGGLVEVTPGRLQYLDIVWNTYAALYHEQMPVDVWNMHLYILPEVVGIANVALGTDPALAYGFAYTHTSGGPPIYTFGDHDNLSYFDEQVRRMRQWMKAHGQEDKPLLLSEFSLLYDENVTDEFGENFTMSRAATFLTKTFNYLSTTTDPAIGMPSDSNRLVQQWVWFSTNFPLGHISNLVTNTTPLTFTSVGNMFRANVSTRPLLPNLQPQLATASTPILTPSQSSVTSTLWVQIVNNGNQLVSVPLTVTFYSDAALTQVIDSVVITSGIPGCARRRVSASVTWPDRGAGFHPFWIEVDSADIVTETNEADNVITGQVFVGTHQIHLPLVVKNYP